MDNDLITKKEEKEVLMSIAVILKRNCEKYPACGSCPLYGKYEPFVGHCCPISVGDNPTDWAID